MTVLGHWLDFAAAGYFTLCAIKWTWRCGWSWFRSTMWGNSETAASGGMMAMAIYFIEKVLP